MADGYVELHAKSFYSFGVGASHVHELLAQAREYEYPALALTDTNLCGAWNSLVSPTAWASGPSLAAS